MSLATGTLIDGKYRIVRILGEGGVGIVYVAEHIFLKKQFALKLLRAEMAQYPEVAARFEQEARATSLVEHENIVRVTDFGRTPTGEPYLIMELLSGRPLSDDLYHNPKIHRDRAIWIVEQVLRGLQAAHAAGIVHRDLKPENVLIANRPDGSELVKVVDFGIAKVREEDSVRLTQIGTVLGTPQYMAPEQARGVADLDHRVDLHAVGVMLYEMLAGQPPYAGDNYNIVLYEILSGKPPALTKVAPEVDPRLASIVMKAFAPERAERFQTALEMREALERYVESIGPKAERPMANPTSVAPAGLGRHSFIGKAVGAGSAAPPRSNSAVDFPVSVPSSGLAASIAAEASGPAMMPLNLDVIPVGGSEIESLKLVGEPGRGGAHAPETVGLENEDRFRPPSAPSMLAHPTMVRTLDDGPLSGGPLVLDELPPALVRTATIPPQSAPRFEESSLGLLGDPGMAMLRPVAVDHQPYESQSTRSAPGPQTQRGEARCRDSSSGRAGVWIGLLALAAVAGGVVWLHPWTEPPTLIPVRKVLITLDGMPDNSVFSVDGVRRFINPIEIDASSAQHEVRVECEGFRTKVMHVSLGNNLVVDAHLEKK